jgi:Protein of unknown function (DUF2809)
MNRRYVYLSLALFLFAVEVLIATKLAHWAFVRGSVGDVLVTMLLYFAALALGDFERWRLATFVFGFACLTEVAQYLGLAEALGLAKGSVLRVIIGDTFQWADIGCYFIGTALALGLDLLARRGAGAS